MSTEIQAGSAWRDADLSNWREVPHSRWAFSHVAELLPVATIRHCAAVKALPTSPVDWQGFGIALGDGRSIGLEAFETSTSTDALVILKDGCLVHESYANGADGKTPHIVMSATKAIIGLLAGILQARNELDVDATVTRYLPELAKTPYGGATLRHLLDMRAGVVLDDAARRAYANATHWEPLPPGEGRTDLLAAFAGLNGPAAQHGGPFRYASENYDLLGLAVERATGRRVAPLLSELVWQPMGAEADALITVDATGAARCTGGLCMLARDLARIGQMVVEGGQGAGSQVVPRDWLVDIAENGDAEAWRTGEWGAAFSAISPAMRYRSGWYVIDHEPRTLFAMGIYGQNLFVDQANGIVMAKLSSWGVPTDYTALGLTHRAFPAIRRWLLR